MAKRRSTFQEDSFIKNAEQLEKDMLDDLSRNAHIGQIWIIEQGYDARIEAQADKDAPYLRRLQIIADIYENPKLRGYNFDHPDGCRAKIQKLTIKCYNQCKVLVSR